MSKDVKDMADEEIRARIIRLGFDGDRGASSGFARRCARDAEGNGSRPAGAAS